MRKPSKDITFINACDCRFDENLLSNALIKRCEELSVKIKDSYKIYEDSKGYPNVTIQGKKNRIHRLIYNYIHDVDYDSNSDLHHIDGNKKNCLTKNLEIIDHGNHTKHHFRLRHSMNPFNNLRFIQTINAIKNLFKNK